MIAAPDQLRHRMTYALSQIVVVSDQSVTNPKAMAYYMDVLGNNAFGNYKNILKDVTYSPAMADYLTYLNNKKANGLIMKRQRNGGTDLLFLSSLMSAIIRNAQKRSSVKLFPRIQAQKRPLIKQ